MNKLLVMECKNVLVSAESISSNHWIGSGIEADDLPGLSSSDQNGL